MTTANIIVNKLQRDGTDRGWIFYDGQCAFCTAVMVRFGPLLRRHHFQTLPLQSPWAQEQLGLQPGAPLMEMKLLAADGAVYGGADALLQVARSIWWMWPLFAIAQIPPVNYLLKKIYHHVAARRHCLAGTCSVGRQPHRRHGTFFEMP